MVRDIQTGENQAFDLVLFLMKVLGEIALKV
jgi:hypothetical protein